MKLRASVSALLLSFTLPAALTEAGLGSLPLAEPRASAQASDQVTEVARQRYDEGVKAFDAGRYEDARAAFLQAYSLKRHPAVLLNLGQSELRSGHPEDAGNHLQQFLREHKTATPEQRAVAEKGVADAKKKAGFIVVIVDATGADVSIDGTMVGKAPLLDPLFVTHGKHTLFASYQGKSATVQVDAKPGTAAAANLIIGVPGAAPAPAPAPAPATPTPAPAPQPAPTTPISTPPAQPAPTPPAAEPGGVNLSVSGGLGSMGPTADETSGQREPFFHWYKRKPIAWVATGLTGAGAIGSIVFFSLAAGSSSSADDIAQQIDDYAEDNPETTMGKDGGYCGPPDASNPEDLPGYEKACRRLREEVNAFETQRTLGYVSLVVGGLGAAGLAAYVLVDWYPKKDWDPNNAAVIKPRITSIAPVIAPGHAGLGITGTF